METLQASFIDFQHYLRRPQYRQPLSDRPGQKTALTLQRFLTAYPLLLGVLLIAAGNVIVARLITGEPIFRPLLVRYSSSVGLLLLASVLAVMIEEAIFRSILRVSPKRIRNLGALLLCILLGYFYRPLKEEAGTFAGFGLVIAWATISFGLGQYLKRPLVFARIERFWKANFRWILYGTGLVYGFMKIIDDVYTLHHWQALLLPLFLMTWLLNGFYFGYVRMKYGYWYAVIIHSLVLLAAMTPEAICLL
ncbi:CPBP family glutamic-type intramembrane protease [Spirosoma sp.]|uniref:CPBP family glutamic-type intramembrane protease n=1 Tax=Spirosoma sp. TaxID=1899569 RepID=UPI00262164F2|nr:CPBP family glutamic-type intramembrane protease [Spirosoma sp.]MCX6214478.1 CPBP family glutamic-type intramembrane protease [Spirosoma sp.]